MTKRIRVHNAGGIALSSEALVFVGFLIGHGVYASSANASAQQSHLATLLTPFVDWPIIGIALLLYAYPRQPKDRKWVLTYVSVTLLLALIAAVVSSALAPLYPLLLVTAVMSVLAGIIKLRWALVALLVASLGYPTLYALRNQGRVDKGATYYARTTSADAQKRIDFDILMAQAKIAHDSNEKVVLPGFGLIIRSGLVPRAIDSHRPLIQTSKQISIAIDDDPGNNNTFTSFGELWFLYGTRGMVLAIIAITVLCGLVNRNRGPFAFVLLAGIITILLDASAAFPDAIAGWMQFVISATVALVLVRPTADLRRPTR